MSDLLGYFEAASQTVPAYDPPVTAPCIVCGKPMEPPRVTVSLLRLGDPRSWFFRADKGCWEGLTDGEQAAYESSVVEEPR